MSFLRMTIPGDYWDVQLYRGKLYLWTMEGSVVTLDWGKLVDSIAESAIRPLAVRMCFAQGDALYQLQRNALFKEDEFRGWLRPQFDEQAAQELDVDEWIVRRSIIDIQDNPLADLPIDTEVYNRFLYATTERGIWNAGVEQSSDSLIDPDPVKMDDLVAVTVRAKSNQLALAASDEGLYRVDLSGGPSSDGLVQVSERPCDRADWSFSSIFADSLIGGGFLVSRYWDEISEEWQERSENPRWGNKLLVDGGTYDVAEIEGTLSKPTVSWAFAERIYTANNDSVSSSRYTQGKIAESIEAASKGLGTIELAGLPGQAIAGRAAVFGTAIEFEGGLRVIQSDESQFGIPGPVTRWRVYPRAKNYDNHLHVIQEDCLVVVACYKDYFVRQGRKRFGVSYR